MASSSVSQESLDMDDYDVTRRNRIRVHRGHGPRTGLSHRTLHERADLDQDRDTRGDHHGNGDMGDVRDVGSASLGLSAHSHLPGDHESPTRGAAARLKDKARSRANHLKKKTPQDKRKLREKRRSTGVVHCMPSTESTGDSLDDDDDEDATHDTKRNTNFNEAGNTNQHHQHTYEPRHTTAAAFSHPRRNKSPSDLEADLEDNQDYDSTVSHSETNLTLIGRSEITDTSSNTSRATSSGNRFGPTGTNSSKFSPESNRAAFKLCQSNISSDADSPRTSTSSSVSSSILNRYREVESPSRHSSNGTREPDSPRRMNNSTPTNVNVSPKIPPRPVGFSVFGESNRGNSELSRPDRPDFAPTSYTPQPVSRFTGRDISGASGAVGSIQSRLSSYQSPRPFVSSSITSSLSSTSAHGDTLANLEKQLGKERDENKKLQKQLDDKDQKIAELEKTIKLLNNECDGLDQDNIKLQEENQALIRAMSKLTTNL